MPNRPGRNDPCNCGSGKKFKKCCGARERTVKPAPRLGATVRGVTVTIPREKLNVKVNPLVLVNQLTNEYPAIAESFDQHFGEEMRKVSSAHARACALITAGFQEFYDDASRAQQIMAVLLLNASDTITAAAGALRAGHRLQPGILLRNVIETLSTVAYMCVEPSAVREYEAGDLKSSKTIGLANDVFPLFGRMYGFFSNQYAHLSSMHGTFHRPGKYEPGEKGARANLAMIRLVVVLFNIIAELAFITFVGDAKYWKRMDGGRTAFDPDEGSLEADIEFVVGGDPDLAGLL